MGIAERANRNVNLKDFADAGTPEPVAMIDLYAPEQRQYILRMPVRAEGSDFMIPSELQWVMPMFNAALMHQQSLGTNHPFVYITVRHGEVTSQTDDEWHVDGFSMKVPHTPEQNYIWTDTNPTEYADTRVVFPDSFDPMRHNIHHFLAAHVGEAEQCVERMIYCLDPYLAHRRPSSVTGSMRTFVRISFVPIEIDDINNTQNPALPRVYSADGVAYRNRLIDHP